MKIFMIVKTFILLVLLLIPATARAQAPVLAWTAPSNTVTAVEASGLTYTLYVNGALAGSGLSVTGASCTGTTSFSCTSSVPATVPSNIGTKLELTSTAAAGGAESPRSVPFIQAPTAPTNLRKQ